MERGNFDTDNHREKPGDVAGTALGVSSEVNLADSLPETQLGTDGPNAVSILSSDDRETKNEENVEQQLTRSARSDLCFSSIHLYVML